LTHYVNSGIYILSPELVKTIEREVSCDMPDVIKRLLAEKKRVLPFLVHEYWVDVGSPADFSKASTDFEVFFKDAHNV
jgi:NDP-sugar pyrophosphorylase family protein